MVILTSQHNTGIADGFSGLGAALEALGKQGIQMIYTTVHQVLAQGNYVLAVSEGTFGGAPTSYYDLWRIENGKIAEHWDVMETIADKSTWQNQNGKILMSSESHATFLRDSLPLYTEVIMDYLNRKAESD